MAILIKAETILDKLKDRLIAAKEWEIESAKNHNNELVNRAQAAQAAFVEVALTVKAMPTVDAVEVVRCKDCVYYEMLNNNEYYCDAIYRDLKGDDEGVDFEPPQDHFCAYGQRREVDEH